MSNAELYITFNAELYRTVNEMHLKQKNAELR